MKTQPSGVKSFARVGCPVIALSGLISLQIG